MILTKVGCVLLLIVRLRIQSPRRTYRGTHTPCTCNSFILAAIDIEFCMYVISPHTKKVSSYTSMPAFSCPNHTQILVLARKASQISEQREGARVGTHVSGIHTQSCRSVRACRGQLTQSVEGWSYQRSLDAADHIRLHEVSKLARLVSHE